MYLNDRTIRELREIITGDNCAHYRSGPDLVSFFNRLGFKESYGRSFPSRWYYTEEKLKAINGTPEMDKCIRNAFAVQDFIENIAGLDELITHFNKYLAFDKWQVVRDNAEITFRRQDKIVIKSEQVQKPELRQDEFLKLQFTVDVDSVILDQSLAEIIKKRFAEAEVCAGNGAPLAAVILIGSILEGLLLSVALCYPQLINKAATAPKDRNGCVKKFQEWTLSNMIDTAAEIGILHEDVKRFSHELRNFRNYIHPYQQSLTQFYPDKQTGLICLQVLKAAFAQVEEYKKNGRS